MKESTYLEIVAVGLLLVGVLVFDAGMDRGVIMLFAFVTLLFASLCRAIERSGKER